MSTRPINPTCKSYSQAYESTNFKRLVFVSGQIPETQERTVPALFEDQCRLTWKNVETQLNAAAWDLKTWLRSRYSYRTENTGKQMVRSGKKYWDKFLLHKPL